MSLNKVPSGKSLPNDFNVIIEITAHSEPVKYEVDKDSGAIFVDRFMSTSMHYPCNYGYIPHTIAGDGDPVTRLEPKGEQAERHGASRLVIMAPGIGVPDAEFLFAQRHLAGAEPPRLLHEQFGQRQLQGDFGDCRCRARHRRRFPKC